MRTYHDHLLDAVMAERRRMSRRSLLSRTVALAGGAVAVTLLAPSARVLAQDATPDTMMGDDMTGANSGGMMASPFKDDLEVLNYALTLEHLEYAFYRDGVGRFEFGNDTFGLSIDDSLAAIRDHEGAHVKALTDAVASLSGTPVAEATYDFGDAYTDPTAFLATAMALENTGVSAYDGAGQYIDDPDLLTAAGSIVAVEARHASYLNLLNGQVPFPDAFEKPLTKDEVLAIAGPFIKM